MNSRLWQLGLAFVAVIACITVAGVPFDVTLRILCGGACLGIMAAVGLDNPGERWPWIALLIALVFNVALYFSPLARVPVTKGDMLYFGVPDMTILLAARTVSYPVTNDHQRAVRQQLIVGVILALPFCAMVLGLMLFAASTMH